MNNIIQVSPPTNQIIINQTTNVVEVIHTPNQIIVENVGIQGAKGDGTIVSINTLEASDQFIETGEDGDDFNIVSTGDTHTFNIPTASVFKLRGLLSSDDWEMFNSKQAALGFTPEDVANKANDFSIVNDTLYPSVQAVQTELEGKVDKINITSGSLGSASKTPSIAYNAQGQITSASEQNIQIAQSQVDNLITDLAGKEPTIAAGTTAQYWRGDKTWQTLDTSVVPENTNLYFTEGRTRATDLTGLNITGGSISSSDSILNAFGKVQNQINGLIGGSIYQGVWNATTNSPTLTSSVGTAGYYYIVNVAGSTNLDGITDWKIGDWAIFDGTVWQKVDNTDAVSSVNGYTGAVNLTTADIPDSLNKRYVTDAQLVVLGNTSGTNTGDNATNTTSNAYADAKVADAINNGVTTIAPSQNAVFDALALKENTITAGTTSQYYRGDKTFQTLNKSAVGLANVDNTSDLNKPISNATQTALNAKIETTDIDTSAKLRAIVTDETGSGALVFNNSPSLVTPDIGAATGTSLDTTEDITASTSTAGANRKVVAENTNNANTSSHATLQAITGGGGAGDPSFLLTITGVRNFSGGIDNSDADSFKEQFSATIGTTPTRVVTTAGYQTLPRTAAFSAYKTSDTLSATGNGTVYTVAGFTELNDQNNNFDATTGIFTAPVTGYYLFEYTVSFLNMNSGHTLTEIRLNTTSRTYLTFFGNMFPIFSTAQIIPHSKIARMTAGDTARVQTLTSFGTLSITVQAINTTFSAFLLG